MIKLITILAALGTVGMVHAVVFNFQSNGTSTLSGNTVVVDNPNLTQYTTGTTPGYTFVDVNYTYTAIFAPMSMTGTLSGTGMLSLKNPANTPGLFDFAFAGQTTRSTTDAMAGTLVNVSFSQLAITLVPDPANPGFTAGMIGSGNFSGNKSGDLGGLSTTSFVSTFGPVPEPAATGALALGVLAMVRRRRRD